LVGGITLQVNPLEELDDSSLFTVIDGTSLPVHTPLRKCIEVHTDAGSTNVISLGSVLFLTTLNGEIVYVSPV
jgi:hypothetical protein